MSYRTLVKMGEEALRRAGCPEPFADARELLLYAAGLNLADYASRLFEEAPLWAKERYLRLLAERESRKPLAYILGRAPFYGRYFLVSPDVLIPRFDTETLVEEALAHLKEGARTLDLCTGSGCIPVTLALEGPAGCEHDASDISPKALAIARKNAERLGARARFFLSDLFASLEGVYDIITANPPYIESEELAGLETETSRYEPELALDGGPDGLAFYRRIADEGRGFLAKGGRLILEIGFSQAEAVKKILLKAGYEDIRVMKDLAGRDRVVSAARGQA